MLRFYTVRPTVEEDDFFYDGKPQTGAGCCADVIGAGFVIAVPNIIKFFGSNAHAMVGDLAANMPMRSFNRNNHEAVAPAVFNSVIYQVRKNLFYFALVGLDRHIRWAIEQN